MVLKVYKDIMKNAIDIKPEKLINSRMVYVSKHQVKNWLEIIGKSKTL